MSLTVATPETLHPEVEKVTKTPVTFDNSYASGGEPLSARQLGLRVVNHTICNVIHGTESSTLRAVTAEYSGGKLHLIDSATGKEMEATKDMSKVVVQVIAFGKP